ncbi:hypothetical protein LINPERPRIM_LOCUS31821, partial [Linum perenne]
APIVAEDKALHTAICHAATSGLQTVVKSDCLNLVEALRKNLMDWSWQCSAWLQLMSETLVRNLQIRASFTPRSHNQIADQVAKASATGLAGGSGPPYVLL